MKHYEQNRFWVKIFQKRSIAMYLQSLSWGFCYTYVVSIFYYIALFKKFLDNHSIFFSAVL